MSQDSIRVATDPMTGSTEADLPDLLEMAQDALDQQRYDMAQALTEDYLEARPLGADAMVLCAIASTHLNEPFKAEMLYRNALRLEPGNGAAWHNYGVLQQKQGHFSRAERSFRHSVKLQPDFPEAYINLGNALDELDRPTEALEAYQQALRRLPENTDVFFNLGYVLNRLHRFAEALTNFDRVLEANDGDAGAWNGRGYALAGLQRYEEALVAYDQALERAPDKGPYYYNRGLAHSALRQREQALHDYQAATHNEPALVEAWFEQINLLIEFDRLPEAEAAIETSRALAPNSPEPDFYQGMLFSQQNCLEQALVQMDASLKRDPDFLHALNNKGNILLSQGRLQEAETCFRQLLERNPEYALAHYNMACVHAQRKHLSLAMDALHSALKLDQRLRHDMVADTDFDPIRHDPLFVRALANIQKEEK